MGATRQEAGNVQEYQLETRHLILLIALVIVLCAASFLFGRWVERQSAGSSPGLPASGGRESDANIEDMGDVAKSLTFFDTLEGNRPAPLETGPRRARSVPQPKPSTPSAATGAERQSSARRSVGEGVMIQVFASRDRASADAVRKRLREKGYTALLITERGSYKVRVGPYADREEAERAASTLRSQENLSTWIP